MDSRNDVQFVFPVCLAILGDNRRVLYANGKPFPYDSKHIPQFGTMAGSYGPPQIVVCVPYIRTLEDLMTTRSTLLVIKFWVALSGTIW